MANLGICRKCQYCTEFLPALMDENSEKWSPSCVDCAIGEYVEWDSDVPDGCPFRLEHLMSQDSVDDLAEEAQELKAGVKCDQSFEQ